MSAGDTPGPAVAGSEAASAARATRGAVVNLLGLLGRLARPLFIIVATRLYGPAVLGVFVVAWAFIETARQFTASGFADAVVMYVSRDLGRDAAGERRVYAAIASALWLVAIVGAAVVGAAYALEAPLARVSATIAEAGGMLHIVAWGVPLVAAAELWVAATRAHMVMKWHALVLGALQPLAMLALAVAFYAFSPSVMGLAWAYVVSSAITAAAAAWAFSRHFAAGSLFVALARPRWHGPIVRFALPQNLNMTFNYFATNVDVIMLGIFGVRPSLIAFYRAAAEITRNLQSIKIAFGHSFAPIIARFHADGRSAELANMYAHLSRLSTIVVAPLALLALTMRRELLLLFDPSYTYATDFMVALVAVPLLAAAAGLAGNVLMMTGHVRSNLVNSIAGAAVNVTLNAVLIPRMALLGAALATLAAAAVVTALQVVEARALVAVRPELRGLWKPFAALAAAAAWVWFWDGRDVGWAARAGLAGLAVCVYGAALVALGLDPKERDALARVWRRS